jgi:hypothetical protein
MPDDFGELEREVMARLRESCREQLAGKPPGSYPLAVRLEVQALHDPYAPLRHQQPPTAASLAVRSEAHPPRLPCYCDFLDEPCTCGLRLRREVRPLGWWPRLLRWLGVLG